MPAIDLSHLGVGLATRAYRYRPGAAVVPVGGISAGILIVIVVCIFLIMWYVLYKSENKKFLKTGKPINHAKVIGLAALCALGIGFIVMCLAGGSDSGDDNSDGADQPMQQQTEYDSGASFVPQPGVPGMTYQNPYAGPVESAAVAPVQ